MEKEKAIQEPKQPKATKEKEPVNLPELKNMLLGKVTFLGPNATKSKCMIKMPTLSLTLARMTSLICLHIREAEKTGAQNLVLSYVDSEGDENLLDEAIDLETMLDDLRFSPSYKVKIYVRVRKEEIEGEAGGSGHLASGWNYKSTKDCVVFNQETAQPEKYFSNSRDKRKNTERCCKRKAIARLNKQILKDEELFEQKVQELERYAEQKRQKAEKELKRELEKVEKQIQRQRAYSSATNFYRGGFKNNYKTSLDQSIVAEKLEVLKKLFPDQPPEKLAEAASKFIHVPNDRLKIRYNKWLVNNQFKKMTALLSNS